MGNSYGKTPVETAAKPAKEGKKRGGKRKRSPGPSTSSGGSKRKVAKLDTAKYVYNKLFCEVSPLLRKFLRECREN